MLGSFDVAIQERPGWVFPGASVDLDFANFRSWGSGISVSRGVTGSPGQDIGSAVVGNGTGQFGYAPNQFGIIYAFPQYTPRITQGRGSWAEGNYTNYCLYCRDQTQTNWVKTSMTATKTSIIGADNTSGQASKLTATGAAATSLQTITGLNSGTTYCFHAYVKRITGTGTVYMTMDGSTYTDITSQLNSNGFTWIQNIPTQTGATSYTPGFQLATSGDAIAVDFVQFENNAYPTTPLNTTSATIARGADEPIMGNTSSTEYNDGLRIVHDYSGSGGPWSMYWEGMANDSQSVNVIGDINVQSGAGCNGGGAVFQAVGGCSATTANTGTFGLGNWNKTAASCSGNKVLGGVAVCLNGGAVAYGTAGQSALTLTALSTHWGIGNNGSAACRLDGCIGRMAFWKRELSTGELQQLTSFVNGV